MQPHDLRPMLLVIACTVSACASSPSRESIAQDQARAQQFQQEADRRHKQERQAQIVQDLAQVPRWALKPPRPDGAGVYAVGMAEDDNLSLSIQKSLLQAEFGLAKVYRQEVSGGERSFSEDRGSAFSSQFSALIDKLVSRVQIVGYEVVEQDTKPIQGRYHTWTLLKMPYDQINRALRDQRGQAMDAEVKTEFDELERRIRARQAELSKSAPFTPGVGGGR